MEAKQQPPYPLRMPPEMRSHYEDMASAAGRSLNAEIVGALQETQALRERVESLEAALKEQAQVRERDVKLYSSGMDAMSKMNGMLGLYLSQVAAMVPKKTDEGKRMIALIGTLGTSVHAKDFPNAVAAAAELVKLGETNGLFVHSDTSTHTPEHVAEKLSGKPGLLD